MYFAYDVSGAPMSVKYNGTMYYFVTNVQGDVTAILNTSGTAVASYTYDAWGNILTTTGSMASTLGTVNPLRYRGYVYDTETGLYYLRSRYYNPVMGRFINADSQLNTDSGMLGSNLFSYCENSPVNYVDADGHELQSVLRRPIGSGGYVGGGFFSIVFPFAIIKDLVSSLIDSSSDSEQKRVTSNDIDWGNSDNSHILKGTRLKGRGRSHVEGWKRFGFDPNDNNNWSLLLPILKEVVDKADDYAVTVLNDGSKYIEYFKTYADEGVRVVVKIWISADELVSKLSDAIPYIIN